MHRFPQGLQRLPFRNKLLGDEALVAGPDDGLHDGGVVELLRDSDFIASGDAAGVVVGDIGCGRFDALVLVAEDSADDIYLHDMHVVDVINQFEVV